VGTGLWRFDLGTDAVVSWCADVAGVEIGVWWGADVASHGFLPGNVQAWLVHRQADAVRQLRRRRGEDPKARASRSSFAGGCVWTVGCGGQQERGRGARGVHARGGTAQFGLGNGCSHDAGCHPGYQAQPRGCVIVADRARVCSLEAGKGSQGRGKEMWSTGGAAARHTSECREGCQQQMSAAGALVSRCQRADVGQGPRPYLRPRPYLCPRLSLGEVSLCALAYLCTRLHLCRLPPPPPPPSLRPLPLSALARESSRRICSTAPCNSMNGASPSSRGRARATRRQRP